MIIHPILGQAYAGMVGTMEEVLEIATQDKMLREKLGIGLECKVFIAPRPTNDTPYPTWGGGYV